MTDPSTAPDLPDAAEITKFLRRFADLMSNGQNATFLRRAAVLLENLTARLTAAIDQEHLWQSKYATVTHQASMLETECDALKHDIEGHLIITTSILAERDELKATLEAREAELSELSGALNHARGELATKLEAHQEAMAGLRAAFDDERKALKATLEARGEELDQLRRDLECEREDCAAKSKTHQGELSELRLAFERERDELQAQLKVRGDELAALHVVSHRERGDRDLIVGETNAIVPKATLRQARAQFEYLAKECIPHGDIASRVMCELGAHTMDLALTAGGEGETDNLPAGEVALSIFAPPGSTSPAIADTM